MEEHLEAVRARLEQLGEELREVRRRLDALESARSLLPGSAADAAPVGAAGQGAVAGKAVPAPEPLLPPRLIPLLGRTLVVLGGAFLLRAITEASFMPGMGGAMAGLLYATWWVGRADRAAGAGDRLSAIFHGFAAVLIAYPLIWETTARFEILPSTVAAFTLVAFPAIGLAVAWRRAFAGLAWTVVLFTLVTTIALAVATRDFLPYTVVLLLLAIAVESFAFRDRWLALRWPTAAILDLLVLMTAFSAARSDPAGGAPSGLFVVGVGTVALTLPLLYLASIGARTLLRGERVTAFAFVQAPAALLVGFVGAVKVLSFHGTDPTPVWIVLGMLGAAYYAAAFAFIDRRSGSGLNFYAYSTLAGLLVLLSSWVLLEEAALSITWSVLALAAVVLGGRYDRITLKFHGALYVVAAAGAAGLLGCALDGLLGDPAAEWRPVTMLALVVALVAAFCYGVLLATAGAVSQWPDLLPRALAAAVFVWSVAGIGAPHLADLLVEVSSRASGPAFLGVSRTAMLALLAVTLAFLGRRPSLRELNWLVYPLLIGGGVKLLWEDLQYGHAVALFLGLALYGGALIITPALMRRETA